MAKQESRPSGTPEVQVFELTMDNAEDQDELNRRLQKPSELAGGLSKRSGRTQQEESEAKSAG